MTKQPSEGAQRAAEKIIRSPWQYSADAVDEFARIIDRETHSAEMRKALGIAKGRIGFLTSCVRSGESLNAIDDTETEAALAQIEAALKGGAL